MITGGGDPQRTGDSFFDTNTTVHIHRRTIYDLDPEGGISDLDSSIHRWTNAVAVVIIQVRRRYDDR